MQLTISSEKGSRQFFPKQDELVNVFKQKS